MRVKKKYDYPSFSSLFNTICPRVPSDFDKDVKRALVRIAYTRSP